MIKDFWDDAHCNIIPYIALMRPCKLSIKHIPLDMGNLIVLQHTDFHIMNT